jgi:hypothetical protein
VSEPLHDSHPNKAKKKKKQKTKKTKLFRVWLLGWLNPSLGQTGVTLKAFAGGFGNPHFVIGVGLATPY